MGKRYSSDKERFAAGVESLLRVAYKLGFRPEMVSRDSWSANKRPGEIADKALRKAGLWAEVQQKASFCLPNGMGTQWPEDYSLEEALAEVRQVVYFKPRNLQPKKPKATPQPASADEMVDVFGKDLTIKNLRAEKRQLLREIKELSDREYFWRGLKEESQGIPILQERERTRLGSRQSAVKVNLSDLHYEEVVYPEQVNWCNEYNPEIAERRLHNLIDGIVWKTNSHRNGNDITQLVQTFGGDMITGYLHLDNLVSNAMPPLEAVLKLKDLLVEYLRHLLKEGKFERIDVCCVCGNHGRNTEKLVHKNYVKSSYEWLMYNVMAQQLEYEERIHFNIATGGHLYYKVFDFVQRDLHGTEVGYQGGIGKLTIPLAKAVMAWDELIKAHHTWIGHYHSYLPHPNVIANGSVIGFNEYAMNKKCRYEPPQQAFALIDSLRGLRDVTALWLDKEWDHKLKGEVG